MGVWSILAEQEQQLLGVKPLQCHSVEDNSSFRLSVFFGKRSTNQYLFNKTSIATTTPKIFLGSLRIWGWINSVAKYFIICLPAFSGYSIILVIIGRFAQGAYLVPCPVILLLKRLLNCSLTLLASTIVYHIIWFPAVILSLLTNSGVNSSNGQTRVLNLVLE